MLKLRALIVAGLLFGATSLVAQEGPVNKHERKGFWIGFGLGYGWLHIEGADGSEGGFSGNFSLGGTISQHVLLGFQSNGWYKSESGIGIGFGTSTAAIHYYPSKTGGLFLTGGLGLGYFSVESFDTEVGFGMVIGGGWDLRVGRNISISPFFNIFGSNINSVTVTTIQTGAGIMFH